MIVSLVLASTITSTLLSLNVLPPSGSFAVGKVDAVLVDPSRLEGATPALDDHRKVRIVAWYPGVDKTGEPARYLSDLGTISEGLVASGEISDFEVTGLRLVATAARAGADVSDASAQYPVILLSPGNATNAEFYSSLAEDLASHGFVVVGVDHPYQATAVKLDDEVAVYAGDPPLSTAPDVVPGRIAERVADLTFVLDSLEQQAANLEPLRGRLDLTRVGVMGHSNGGIAAAELATDPRVDAVLNLDGQSAGGPLSSRPEPAAPTKPFLFLTKETELHPALESLFEDGGRGTFRVVVAGAQHDQFGDAARFSPRLLPISTTADGVLKAARGFSVAFFDHTLRDAPRDVLGDVDTPLDVLVLVYPLERADS